ncbi:MAG: dTDP-4-dehydrorhamnose 3,5-epimerase [Flavobacteriales bacterium]|nr:dTDP-4-dehydrorhamnose 3,5-epimerase [Flavobacteriales bacterium]|tara:strand:- start:94066 stop:94608 length:543 start_codon:yes stop_codon:yes gene_type:complete
MTFEETTLIDAYVITPNVFGDHRGYFMESFNKKCLEEIIGPLNFVQDNQSLSSKGVLRGLHFQAPPFAQGKLVRVIKGAVNDVIVDIRKKSPTYGKSFKVLLSENNFKMLWIPPGFAHGFETLENDTIFSYKVTNYYHKESEGAIKWNDPTLNIKWDTKNPVTSTKDNEGELFKNFTSQF